MMKTRTKMRLTALTLVTLMITLLLSNITMAIDTDDLSMGTPVEITSNQEATVDDTLFQDFTETEEGLEWAESGYMGIAPFITVPPFAAVLFVDYATGLPLFDQVHVPTIGALPNISVSIEEHLPENWQVHHWYINYYVFEREHSQYRYETVLEGNILLHILPNYEEITPGAWLMLPTFIVYSGPIPPLLTGTVTCDLTGRPIPGVTVNLYDEDGNVIDSQVTDDNGFFDFGEVPIGDLEVGMDHNTIPDGYEILPCSYENRQITTSPGGVYEEHFFIRPIRPPTITKAATHVNGEAYTGQYVDVGDVITYVLTVHNPNFTTLNNHLVRDNLPDGIALVVDSVTVFLASTLVEDLSEGNTVEVVLNLPSGNTTITFDATVTVEAFDNIINVALIYGPPGEGEYGWCEEEEEYVYVPGDREEIDDDTENIPVEELKPPTLIKEATHLNSVPYNGEPVDVGDVVTYVLTVNNPNLRPLNDHLVRDILPSSLSLDVDSVEVFLPSTLVEDLSRNNTVEVILDLPPGNTTITFDATVTIDAFDNIINIAHIYGPPGDGEYQWCDEEEEYVYLPGDREEVDDDTETIPVVELVPPTLLKEATYVNGVPYQGEPVDVGDEITYLLTVNNPNLRPLGNFLVRDELPVALSLNVNSVEVYLTSSLVENLSDGNTLEVILNLPPGDTTITFTAIVTEYAVEDIINVATLYGPPGEGDYEWCEEEEEYVYVPGDRNEVDDDTETIPVVDFDPPTLTKEATHLNGVPYDGEYVFEGDVVTYVLTVNNPNLRPLNDFLVRDELPNALALNVDSVEVYLASSLVEDLSVDNTLEVILNLPPGDTTITFTAVVTEYATGNIINIAYLYGPPGEGDDQWCEEEEEYVYVPGDRVEVDDDRETLPVEELEPPTLTKEATHLNGVPYDGEYVFEGDVVTYVLTVNNPNLRPLNDFLVRDELPNALALNVDSVEVYLASSLVEDLSADNTLEVILNLPPGDTTITFTAVVTDYADEEIINIATLYGPPGEGDDQWCEEEEEYVYVPGDRVEVDDDRETLPVEELEPPTITKAATHVNGLPHDGDSVAIGDVITYVLTVNNPNLRPLEDFLVRDELPEGLALNLDSVVVAPASALVEDLSVGNTVEVILNLPSGNTLIAFTAVVTEDAKDEIVNVATLYGPPGEGEEEWCEEEEEYIYVPGDRDKVDDDDEVVEVEEEEEVEVPALRNPTLTKSANYQGNAVTVGDTITYTLRVNNPNDSVLENFTVVDALPDCLQLNVGSILVNPSAALVNNQSQGNTVRVLLNLPPGNTIITFTAVVTEEAEDYIENIAFLYEPESEEPIDEDDVTVDMEEEGEEAIRQPGPPTINKAANHHGNYLRVGDVVVYRLTVNNPNDEVMEDFLVRDALPTGLTLNTNSVTVNPASAVVGNISTANNTVSVVLNLPPGNTTITFTATVNVQAPHRITNVGYLYGPEAPDGERPPVDDDRVTVNVNRPNVQAPQTGDHGGMFMWMWIFGLGLLGFLVACKQLHVAKKARQRISIFVFEDHEYGDDFIVIEK